MPDKNESIASVLKLLIINNNGIGAAVEELAKASHRLFSFYAGNLYVSL